MVYISDTSITMSKDVCTWQVILEIFRSILEKKCSEWENDTHVDTFYPQWPRQALAEESRWIFLSNTPVTTHCLALGFTGWSCWILAVKSSQLLTMARAGQGYPWEKESVSPRLRKFLFCILWGATWVRLFSSGWCWFLARVLAGVIWANSCPSPVAPYSTRL